MPLPSKPPAGSVKLTKNALTSGGDSVAFVSVADAEVIAFDQPAEDAVLERQRVVERLRREGVDADDDAVGGDTNKNGATNGGANWWRGIIFNATSDASSLNHLNLRYAGESSFGAFEIVDADNGDRAGGADLAA